MTLDMLEILIDAVVKGLDSVAAIEYYGSLVFIACALGVGSVWALTILAKDYSFNVASRIIS